MKVWFQNRRIKWRKHHLEMTQQRLAIIRQHQLPITSNTSTNDHLESSLPRDGGGTGGTNVNAGNQNIIVKSIASDATPNAIESELSVCTDSMDSNSLHEVDDL